MRKNMIIILVMSILLVLSGCGSKTKDFDDESSKETGDSETTEVEEINYTLIESMTNGDLFIMFESSGGEGYESQPPKDGNVDNVYVFKDGNFTKYSNTYRMGLSISDLNSLSDEDLVKKLEDDAAQYSKENQETHCYSKSFSKGDWCIGVFTDNTGNKVSRIDVLGYYPEDSEYVNYLEIYDVIGNVNTEIYSYEGNSVDCNFQIYDKTYSGWLSCGRMMAGYYDYVYVRGDRVPEFGMSGENVVLDKGDGTKISVYTDEEFDKAADLILGK